MPGEFDMDSAVSQIGDGLGLGDGGGSSDLLDSTSDTSTSDGGLGSRGPEDGTGAPSDKSAEVPDSAISGTPPATTTPEGTPPAIAAPRTWRQEAAAMWAQVPAPVQQEILKREEDIFKGIETYKQAAEFGAPIRQVMDPYLPILQQYNIQPAAQVADMMKAHYTLAFGTQAEKLALIQQVVKDYNVDLTGLNAQANGGDGQYVDPQVARLQSEINELKSHLTQQDRAAIEAKRQEITRHVEAFAADPKNVYFEELATDIAHLLRTGAEKSVEAAYQTALWRNPSVRAKELARQQAEREAAEKRAREEKLEAVRKATAANVRTQARSGSATAPLGSMDDTLASTLASIRSRA